MLNLKNNLKERIFSLIKKKYPIEISEIDIIHTPQTKMGDLALTLPFILAKKIKRKPGELAMEIISLLSSLNGIDKLETGGGGYINLFLSRKQFFLQQLLSLDKKSLFPEEDKIIIEHTNINPNKAAHIGHLRNAVLGDTLGCCLKYKGENVEIQNYIDDTGIQVVDVVLGFLELEGKKLQDIKKIKDKFDYYCWDLYTRVTNYIESNPEVQKRRSEILKNIEERKNPEVEIARYVSRRILRDHLNTMQRIGISYDLLPCESSILNLKFWEKAFNLLKEKNSIYFVKKGINKGCWVMKLEDDLEKEKIILRSDETVTYVGKDIAYQLWKFGLLEKDFFYKPFCKQDNKTIWITTSLPQSNVPQFGKGSLVYNVIDTRQSYLQKIVVQGLKSLKFLTQAEKSIHFSYEMVCLSPKSLKELNIQLSEEDKGKNFLEISGRKGLGVKADDLLDKLEEKALSEVSKRNLDLSSDEKRCIANKIACAALRYFMLKFARNTVIIFDFEDALNFEGETGPYLQYTLVRIKSIFRKLKEREGFDVTNVNSLIDTKNITLEIISESELNDFWEIILYASKLDEEVLHSVYSLEFSHLAKFTFNLCQKFNTYYHRYPILAEKNGEIKKIRILTIFFIEEILKKSLNLMGIPQLERM